MNQQLIEFAKKYLHQFEVQSEQYSIIERDMQDDMMRLGFVDLWQENIEKYEINSIQINDPKSYKPAIDSADLIMLKVLISYAHRRVTHWYETSLYNYKEFFIYALAKLIEM